MFLWIIGAPEDDPSVDPANQANIGPSRRCSELVTSKFSACQSVYEVVLVVDVLVVMGEELVVGPPALSAERARAIPNPAKASVATIIVVFVSQSCALCTPAGLPGANTDESASAPVVQSANDVAKQMAFFISTPRKVPGRI